MKAFKSVFLLSFLSISMVHGLNLDALEKAIENKKFTTSKAFLGRKDNPLLDPVERKKILIKNDGGYCDVPNILEDLNQIDVYNDKAYALYDFLFEVFAGNVKGYTFSGRNASDADNGLLGKMAHTFIKMGMLLGINQFNAQDTPQATERINYLKETYGWNVLDNAPEPVKKAHAAFDTLDGKQRLVSHFQHAYDAINIGLQEVLPFDMLCEKKEESAIFDEIQKPFFANHQKFAIEGSAKQGGQNIIDYFTEERKKTNQLFDLFKDTIKIIGLKAPYFLLNNVLIGTLNGIGKNITHSPGSLEHQQEFASLYAGTFKLIVDSLGGDTVANDIRFNHGVDFVIIASSFKHGYSNLVDHEIKEVKKHNEGDININLSSHYSDYANEFLNPNGLFGKYIKDPAKRQEGIKILKESMPDQLLFAFLNWPSRLLKMAEARKKALGVRLHPCDIWLEDFGW